MQKIVGFAKIKKDATTCKGALNPQEFIGKSCPVMEFSSVDGGVLILNPEGNALAMFDKDDVQSSFECGYSNGIVTPPNLEMLEQMMYVMRAQNRKGGYNGIVCGMVVESSLMVGKFNDNFLWARENEEKMKSDYVNM